MRIVQVLPTISFGDAVGNNCRAIDSIITEAGYETAIFAENIDQRLPADVAKPISELMTLNEQDVLLYHLSTKMDRDITEYGGQLIFQYHNVTPPDYYSAYDVKSVELCRAGLEEMHFYKDAPILCWADSEYNRQDLINAGYSCPIHTIPILVPFEDYEKPADEMILEQYDDDYTNFLFVGRVVPNKAFEDVIRTFAWYQKHLDSRCRLFLVGNTNMTSYVGRLKNYIKSLGVKNIIFPGHISFNAILAYYRLADIFLCMSRHEGFCVPLLEAMYFHVPIIARNTTAIPYTLGGSGVLVEDNDPVKTALLAHQILQNPSLKDAIVLGQNVRLRDFSHEKIKETILYEIREFMQ